MARIFRSLSLLLVVLVSALIEWRGHGFVSGEVISKKKRKSKEIENKIEQLSDGTKKRIQGMRVAGMPESAIAEKIAYEAGGKNTAKRIVEALGEQPVKVGAKASKGLNSDKPKSKTQVGPQPKPKTMIPKAGNQQKTVHDNPQKTKANSFNKAKQFDKGGFKREL